MRWTITEQYAGMLLRDFLFDVLQFSNRLVIKAKSTEGQILVNGQRKTVRYILQLNDQLEIKLPNEKRSSSIAIEKTPLDIVYEDDFLLIINKESGMATIPSRHHRTGTIANGLLYYYKEKGIPYTVHIVTRLDKDTSGLVLVAKHQYSHSLLSTMQRNNGISRNYITIVEGKLLTKSGTIDVPIGRKPDSIIERMVRNDGKKAITHYQVVEETDLYSVVEVELETGRTHQIRVHFSFLGHPLLGDDLYGGKKGSINRQALHCCEISFVHPFIQEIIHIRTELPLDMSTLVDKKMPNERLTIIDDLLT